MGKILIIAVIVVLVFVAIAGVSGYNRVVKLDQGVSQSWSQVESQYQRRTDLIPNLVETVKGAANFEQETLTKVIEARASASQVKITPEMLNDPQALQKFQQVQDELAGTENRIANERRRFTETVQTYNTAVKTFPMNMLAGMFGFQPKAYFEAQEGAEGAPKVNF